jgi:uncharacterized protein YggE
VLLKTTFRCCVFLSLLTVTEAYGQVLPDQEGVVTGSGTIHIKKSPERLRLQIDLLAKGKNLNESLQRLKERRQAVVVQLKSLGAIPETIEIADPTIYASQNAQQQMLNMMIRQRMGKSAKAKTAQASMPVTVSATLKAEWPLKFNNPDELLSKSHELQEKIKAADLAGTKEVEKLTPEEQELQEELQAAEEMSMYGQPENKPGTPAFVYVASISEQERAEAIAKAFQKAKGQATQLAQAAGATLGSLRNLNAHSAMGQVNSSLGNPYAQYAYQMIQQQLNQIQEDGELDEAISPQAGPVSIQVVVNASFALK